MQFNVKVTLEKIITSHTNYFIQSAYSPIYVYVCVCVCVITIMKMQTHVIHFLVTEFWQTYSYVRLMLFAFIKVLCGYVLECSMLWMLMPILNAPLPFLHVALGNMRSKYRVIVEHDNLVPCLIIDILTQ